MFEAGHAPWVPVELAAIAREGFDTARRRGKRMMRNKGLHGVIRGKMLRATISDKAAP